MGKTQKNKKESPKETPGIPFNYADPLHQFYGVKLTIMRWASGDMKDVYEDDTLEGFMDTFKLKSEEEVALWLNANGARFDDSFLQLNPHTAAQALAYDDFQMV